MEEKIEDDNRLLIPTPIKNSIRQVSTKEMINPKVDLARDVSPARKQRRYRNRRQGRRRNSED